MRSVPGDGIKFPLLAAIERRYITIKIEQKLQIQSMYRHNWQLYLKQLSNYNRSRIVGMQW
jgi:hypothetical protein